MPHTPRVLIIGLDGATLDLIEPWAQAGHLPGLSALMKAGGYSRLRSIMPVVSAGAWVTFMTGTNPGKHGVFDFVYREAGTYRLRPVTHPQTSVPSLWKLLSDQGKRVGIINVPMTYPPEEVNGFLVSGLGTPNFKEFTYPVELGRRLLQDGYQVNRKMYYAGDREDAFLAETYEIIQGISRAALTLMEESEWDLFTVVFRDTDDIAHAFWRYMDPTHPKFEPGSRFAEAILGLYRRLDSCVGELVEASGPQTTVFIVSDHGFGPLYKDVYLNEWLRQAGYLTARRPASQRHVLSRLGITRERSSRIMRKLGLGRLERRIKDRIGDRIELLPRDTWPDFSEGIDWPSTRAYSYGYQGQIYVNLAGREPQGTVQPGEEYAALREEICQALARLVDPADGKPVVDSLYRREELYNGPAINVAPDIVVSMRGLAYITRLGYELSNQPGEIFSDSRVRETGGHRLEGTLIGAGPTINPDIADLPPAWLGDIAPTVLHVLGCPVPEWMDGKVLSSWLVPEFASRPVTPLRAPSPGTIPGQSVLTTEEEQEIMERLKDLGYLG